MNEPFDIDAYIGKVPNFPKEGILFYDISPILQHPPALAHVIQKIQHHYKDQPIDAIAGLEARGFYFAPALAIAMQKPFYPIRKAGKLPGKVDSQSYDLEYGSASIEMQPAPQLAGKRVLLLDDLIATGGTLQAAATLLQRQGATVEDLCGVIGLPFLNYQESLASFRIYTLINYDKENL
ncbi:adenine phosphoribosyltransferase [Entomospira culicis]|uniref:Adenine phosphoribosyltransferase n=1 Tax=Entomospira culicis TaxID=2719989 RepID=A0A968GGQ5_9SPIO|nr:adenine phosphoribosyltransferase [Entomospira culicis]NIZ19332.1 adenine phosphoribosyltransferase [Entomospira culicis]NIZ69763.1 adenine phosphoribosyltransferase [Entomospira culicis]WDI36874.1 adenine phosphoribosyltransferase [Entomospira culicis]WDI38503.1 adenine phosphoribosyltransferase [Entomospira culicis]